MRSLELQRGIALALVLWFVAAMSLLVAGIVSQARVDLKLAQVHAAQSIATAAGDGATQLFLADLIYEAESNGRFILEQSGRYQVGPISVQVEAMPSNALINIRTASVDVLRELLIKRKIDAPEASVVAKSIVSWRDKLLSLGTRDYVLKTLEDVFLAPEVDRRIFDALRDHAFVGTVPGISDETLNFFLTPFLRDVLIAANEFQQQDFILTKSNDVLLSASGDLRVDAIIEYSGRKWLRRQWIKRGGRSGSAMGWKSWRVEPARIYLEQNLQSKSSVIDGSK